MQILDSDSEAENSPNEGLANPPEAEHSEPLVDQYGNEISSDEEAEVITDPDCLEENWGNFYQSCPRWKDFWVATKNPDLDWPKGIKTQEGRMYLHERLCIPLSLQNVWIRQNHSHMGHPGWEKLRKILESPETGPGREKPKSLRKRSWGNAIPVRRVNAPQT